MPLSDHKIIIGSLILKATSKTQVVDVVRTYYTRDDVRNLVIKNLEFKLMMSDSKFLESSL